MKIYELIRYGMNRLKDCNIAEAETDAELLWLHVSQMDKTKLLLEKGQEAEKALEQEYLSLIEKRSQRIPLQYITGIAGFMGMDFHTAKDVLIPRMDTETLVMKALELIKNCKTDFPKVLDLCCGSGCIGISVKKLSDKCHVTLADISDAALALTKENAMVLGASCDVIKSDLFEKINDRYDFIISNPPYIESDVIESLMPEVRNYEPRLALDGSSDGLVFYRRIIWDAAKYLKDDGYVLFEIGNNQAEDVQHLLVDAGYDDIHVIKDLCGNDRVVYGHYRI
ncbi:MAG: peptide chain release factor N(5)-glutamine methyltransferase [Coprococcus sp.]|nr:peptide chain release factor N(5)-glutamine methyltransferase [Coprococcus sp.]